MLYLKCTSILEQNCKPFLYCTSLQELTTIIPTTYSSELNEYTFIFNMNFICLVIQIYQTMHRPQNGWNKLTPQVYSYLLVSYLKTS